MDEQGLARLQAAALEHVGPDGEVGFRDRAGLDHGQAGGTGSALLSWTTRIIRIAAARHEGHDRVARQVARGARARGHDLAGDLEPEDVRTRRAAADSRPAAGERPAG